MRHNIYTLYQFITSNKTHNPRKPRFLANICVCRWTRREENTLRVPLAILALNGLLGGLRLTVIAISTLLKVGGVDHSAGRLAVRGTQQSLLLAQYMQLPFNLTRQSTFRVLESYAQTD